MDPSALLSGAATHAGHGSVGGMAMWAAHVLAAIVTIVVLRKGGLAALALMQVLGLAVPRRILRTRQPLASRRPQRLPWVQVPGLPDLGAPLRALRYRGPPVLPAFAP